MLATGLAGFGSAHPSAQASAKSTAQKIDEDYTARIKEATADARILTELVDHMPASRHVPSPLKFLGYIPGEPGQLTYHKDIVRYLEALDKASRRVTMCRIGKSEEGREMVARRGRRRSDDQAARQVQADHRAAHRSAQAHRRGGAGSSSRPASRSTTRPAASTRPRLGSPEMLMELAFRLAVEETPFIQTIRNNVIFVFTPATRSGRPREAGGQLQSRSRTPASRSRRWSTGASTSQHDNNRDGIGVGLKLTQNMLKTFLDWHPQVFHDLHESVKLLYVSTGTGPYNTVVDPIQVNEWWLLAQTEIMEMTKRGVPGVWTYNYYDGWVPNYMFWIGVTHNSIGRFYETQSYGGAATTRSPRASRAASGTGRTRRRATCSGARAPT